MPLVSLNPFTEEVIKTFDEYTDQEVEKKLTLAEERFSEWRNVDFEERARSMRRLAEIFRREAFELGKTMTQEMGKPIKSAMAEIEKCAWVCDYYADKACEMLAPEIVQTEFKESSVRFDPLGIVLAIMPWNFPFWQVMRFAAPALMAGNVALLKHASNVSLSSLVLENTCEKAGFPKGCFTSLLVGSARVANLIKDRRIKAVTLTGSEHAGAQVGSLADNEIKKSVLELGGSDAFIVLEDANLETACTAAVIGRLQNAGQSCIAAKRFIIMESISEKFISLLQTKFESVKLGDPIEETTEMGPLATKQIRDEVNRQVKTSLDMGARLITGGKIPKRQGYFYEPTILTNILPGMPAYEEEIFGPVASILIARDDDHAVTIANNSTFALGCSVWTHNVARAKKMIPNLDSGSVFVNSIVKSDPRLPFGGEKKSGYGRELSHYGIKEFVNIKTVVIN